MKVVVLITTGQPSVNPRIVKEADALYAAGFEVMVLFCFWMQWADDADQSLLKNVRWSYTLVGGSPSKNKLLYFLTKARFKINKELNKKFGNSFLFAERSQARCFDELLRIAKSIKAQWYIGHNLGALSVAVKSAAFHKALAGFDFEDYHREENAGMPIYEQRRIVYLEQKYIPRLHYISTSSPMITERVKRNFPIFSKPIITLLNCFPLSQQPEFSIKKDNKKSLQLFWFSQTVGANRGLEIVLDALKHLSNPNIHLTLVGRYDKEMQKYINDHARSIFNSIHLAGIITPNFLPDFAAQFDIGLAAEVKTSLNRNICLTNKIFTYLLAGNCILASDTAAQKDFMASYEDIGLLYRSNNAEDLANQIRKLYDDHDLLNRLKRNALELAQTRLNWENESKKLLKILD